MDKPNRKPNRLKNFSYSNPGKYFVTICTKNKEKILCNIVGGDAHIAPQIQLTACGMVVEQYIKSESCIEKYVIMPNHVHMIIHIDGSMWASTPTKSTDSIVRSIKILTTKALGTSIFQRSFHDHVIRGEADYKEIWTYIENNPLKWSLDQYYVK